MEQDSMNIVAGQASGQVGLDSCTPEDWNANDWKMVDENDDEFQDVTMTDDPVEEKKEVGEDVLLEIESFAIQEDENVCQDPLDAIEDPGESDAAVAAEALGDLRV
jgi:hypothetical protein